MGSGGQLTPDPDLRDALDAHDGRSCVLYCVLYCGNDLEAARVAYHSSAPTDFGGSPGNPARQTLFEGLDQEGFVDDDPGEMRNRALARGARPPD